MLCKFSIFAQPIITHYMATVTAFIRTSNKDSVVNIRFRLSDGRNTQLFYKSDILITPSVWDKKKEKIKTKTPYPEEDRLRINNSILEYKKMILSIYAASGGAIKNSGDLTLLIDKHLHPDKYAEDDLISCIFDSYLSDAKPSENYCKSVRLVKECVRRFSIYESIESGNTYIRINDFTEDVLKKFMAFLTIEYTLFDGNGIPKPGYESMYPPRTRTPKERGRNSINKMMKVFRTVWNHAMRHGCTDSNPFALLEVPSQTYGTPYYITIEERNLIADFDLSEDPRLAEQRDIFIFQCLIGCRISDLYRLTPANVVNDTIQYIAKKTMSDKPKTIIVPLNSKAQEILKRYYDGIRKEGSLFPFISEQKYNKRIKQIFRKCGIARNVTVYNSRTGKEETRPICEIASSHLARRTFVGNLYKKTGNIDLVSSLSGHSPTSSAFFRYRDIDIETKKRLVEEID